MAAIWLLLSSAMAATKAPPDLSGVWKLDRDLTTAPYMHDDTLVIRQSREQVRFIYRDRDGKATATDVFLLDGSEQKRYTTRIERAFYRARWQNDSLVIVTRHFLDAQGYQNYKETDTWALSKDGKTLTAQLSDGKVAIFYWKGPAPKDESRTSKEFHARGVNELAPLADADASCRLDLAGAMQSKLLGKGTYRMCAAEDDPAPVTGCTMLSGTLTITASDEFSRLVTKVAGRFCPKTQQFIGTYEVDGERITGEYSGRIGGGSGTVQFRHDSNTLELDGVLLYE